MLCALIVPNDADALDDAPDDASDAPAATPSDPPEPPRRRGGWRWALGPLVLVLCVVLSLTYWDIDQQSPTSDEYAHLVRGIAYWTTADPRLSNAHPPLANALSALPVSFDDTIPDFTAFDAWETKENANFIAIAYGREDYEGMRHKLMQARHVTVVWLLLALGHLYFMCRRELGLPAAIGAIVLLGLNPTVLAQARVVTTDLPVMAAVIVACGEYVRHLRGGRGTWVTVPLAVGVAVTTKYSALLLCLLLPLFGLAVALRGQGRHRGQTRRRAVGRWALHTLTTALGILLIINVTYRFSETGYTVEQLHARHEPVNYISERHPQTLVEDMLPLSSLPRSTPIPAPYHYLFGVALIRGHQELGSRTLTFWGTLEKKGHWLYFPTMVVTKTPLSILGLWLVGAALWWKRRRLHLLVGLMGGVAAIMLLVSMKSTINLGVRHALPLLGLGVVPAAAAIALVLRRHGTRRWVGGALVLLVGSTAVDAIAAGPRFLGWWNPLVDARRGHLIASIGDDWFQDRTDLAAFIERHQLRPFYYAPLHPLGNREMHHLQARFRDYKCQTNLPDRSWVAVHVFGWMSHKHRCYLWSRGLEPVITINDHIFIYWLPDGTHAKVEQVQNLAKRKRDDARRRRGRSKRATR